MQNFTIDSKFLDHIIQFVTTIQDNLLPAMFDLLVGIVVIKIVIRITRRALKLTHIQTGLRYVLTSIIEGILWALLVVVLLDQLGFRNIILFFTGSIAAIGIAMAAGGSTLVSDIVAAIFLAQDADFNVGDEVIVGETPTQGVIVRMDTRRIRLRDGEGVLHIIPNSLVERKEWVVVKRRAELSTIEKAAKAARQLKQSALEKRPKNIGSSGKTSKNEQ